MSRHPWIDRSVRKPSDLSEHPGLPALRGVHGEALQGFSYEELLAAAPHTFHNYEFSLSHSHISRRVASRVVRRGLQSCIEPLTDYVLLLFQLCLLRSYILKQHFRPGKKEPFNYFPPHQSLRVTLPTSDS